MANETSRRRHEPINVDQQKQEVSLLLLDEIEKSLADIAAGRVMDARKALEKLKAQHR